MDKNEIFNMSLLIAVSLVPVEKYTPYQYPELGWPAGYVFFSTWEPSTII